MKKGSEAFKKRNFGGNAKLTRADVKKKFMEMGVDNNGERLKMAVLYFLSSIIYYPPRTGKDVNSMEDLFLKYVDDLELCETFPWGRYSYDRMVESIRLTMDHYEGKVGGPFTLPGFCIPFELLALESILHLGQRLRESVDLPSNDCPRMCMAKGKNYR